MMTFLASKGVLVLITMLTGIRGEPPKGRSIKKRAPKLQEHQTFLKSVNANKNSEGCAGSHHIVQTPSSLITCQHR